jgi:hypothetical protein
LYNHCIRTYLLGSLLCEQAGTKPDTELAYLGSILHDLALVVPYDRPGSFEQEGATQARELLTSQGYPDDRSALVHDGVANHLDVGAEKMAPEVALVHLGAGADVIGLRLERLERPAVDAIIAEYPRLDFKREVSALLESQVERKPDSKIASLYKHFKFGELIQNAPFDE